MAIHEDEGGNALFRLINPLKLLNFKLIHQRVGPTFHPKRGTRPSCPATLDEPQNA